MVTINPTEARKFAQEVVTKLRNSGYEALWAGGCVRDQLLGCVPKDYDVATSATPVQIREVFGKRRTLPIGAAFGVITVLGPRVAGQIEVATFRRDATYSDGRRPDAVAFSDAKEDARRRDFTINGLFYDPLSDRVLDYVGGQQDLTKRVIRAIGDPEERLSEDKLRMLRAIRFATTLNFDIDSRTMDAVRRHADELRVVSVERITAELKRLLQDANRRRGVELLQASNLLVNILPELVREGDGWHQTVETLDALQNPTIAVALAALLRSVYLRAASDVAVKSICRRWKLSNVELDGVVFCLEQESTIRQAPTIAWPTLQRVLVHDRIGELICYCEAVARVVDGSDDAIQFCRQILARPQAEWNPLPLITGDDLLALGIPAGPGFRDLITAARDAQLTGAIATREAALEFAVKQWQSSKSDEE